MSGPEYAEPKAICSRLKGLSMPPADRPDRVAAATLKGCSSEALYFGIGTSALSVGTALHAPKPDLTAGRFKKSAAYCVAGAAPHSARLRYMERRRSLALGSTVSCEFRRMKCLKMRP
jgi:hypothetical protein